MVDLALEWIDGVGEAPFFLVLHLIDPHTNYDAPPPFRGTLCGGVESQLSLPVAEVEGLRAGAFDLADADLEFLRGAYLEEVAFIDGQIERFLAGLQARALFDDSLIVMTADHGEELFDHGGFEHGHAMWEEILHVPLWVHGPGVRPGRTTTAVTIADVAPTILEAVGLPAQEGQFGVSLWRHLTGGKPVSERPLIAEGTFYGAEQWAILSGGNKLIRRAEGGDLLFDLGEDPAEREDRLALKPELAEALGAELTRQLERARAGRAADQANVDDALSAGIEDLGYTSD
jgi:arylsulfatase A-like enzyme